jgi:hypothetical protein
LFLGDETIISLIIITPGPFWHKKIPSLSETRSSPRSAWYSSTLKMESVRRSEVCSPIRNYIPDLYSSPEVGFPDSGYTWYYRVSLPPELANGLSSSWTNVPPQLSPPGPSQAQKGANLSPSQTCREISKNGPAI